jgi:predicted nucleotidyltransferase
MKLTEVIKILKKNSPELVQLGVKSLALFGSTARNEATSTSDVDILVEFDRPVGLFEFVRLKMLLEEMLNKKVDLVTPDALHPALRDRILSEAIYVC